ncbi:MAG: flavin reductase family protein [Lachnospiraceae bacterium]|nr:flavin reductase family protein [Lachnospiraceae bacterium]
MSKQSWKAGNMLYPVPAVMVSCKRDKEKANIITVAWAGTVCSEPAMISISVRPERYSHDIIEKSGEFVVNLVTEDLTRICDWCGVKSGKDHDKFKEMKLTEYRSEFMDTPAIAESPVNIYCKVVKTERLGSHDMFIGEVMGVTVDDSHMDANGRFKLEECGLIAYSHGEYYALGKKLGKFGYSVKKPERKTVKGASKSTVRKKQTYKSSKK